MSALERIFSETPTFSKSILKMASFRQIDSNFIHIALATYPKHEDIKGYVTEVKDKFYNEYSRRLIEHNNDQKGSKSISPLYEPLAYHLFGQYDIAFISLINNSKFGQKPFWSPKFTQLHTNSFQIFTGICPDLSHEGNFDLKETFSEITKNNYNFISICNLKLNNGLLIGNGQILLDAVMNTVKEKVKEKGNCDYLIIQSFSWFEINLILFANDPEVLMDIIFSLRSLRPFNLKIIQENSKVKEFDEESEIEKIISNSLYFSQSSGLNYDKSSLTKKILNNTHIFADTHTYIGVRLDVMNSGSIDFSNIRFQTEIELQTKPGHTRNMITALEGLKIFDEKSFKALMGKSDYQVAEKNPQSFLNNQKLFQAYFGDDGKYLKRHIRNFKTTPYFEIAKEENDYLDFSFIDELTINIDGLSFSPSLLSEIHLRLKAMKVSRQIRDKIMKMYFNYNLSIRDEVIFTYFVDFILFMSRLTGLIEKEYNNFIESMTVKVNIHIPKSVKELEDVLRNYIDSFDEAYRVRMLNCYEFEDMYDFELDFNSSTQQLLSTYNMIAQKISRIFFKADTGHIIRLHSQDTIGNHISINCSINHLTFPEFIFFTLGKEILNSITSIGESDKALEEIDKIFCKSGKALFDNVNEILIEKAKENKDIETLMRDGVIEINYLIIDVYRLIYTCNFDIELLEYWIWSFALQNTSMYNSKGLIQEVLFTGKLFQIMSIFRLMGRNIEPQCPIPELYNYWLRYFSSYKNIVDSIFNSGEIARVFKKHFSNKSPDDSGLTFIVDNDTGQLVVLDHKVPAGLSKSIDIETGLSILSSSSLVKRGIVEQEKVYRSGLENVLLNKYRLNVFTHVIELMGDKLENGQPVFFNPSEFRESVMNIDESLFLVVLINAYLHKIYQLNNKKVSVFRRSLLFGEPDQEFISDDGMSGLYKQDNLGGIFFISEKSRINYYKIRNAILQSIWHFSTVVKKDFILGELSKSLK